MCPFQSHTKYILQLTMTQVKKTDTGLCCKRMAVYEFFCCFADSSNKKEFRVV